MKLLRYGPFGAEKPALLAKDGSIRCLSSVVRDIDGFALSPAGPRLLAAARALLGARGFGLADKLSAVAMSLGWQWRRFHCPPSAKIRSQLPRKAGAVIGIPASVCCQNGPCSAIDRHRHAAPLSPAAPPALPW